MLKEASEPFSHAAADGEICPARNWMAEHVNDFASHFIQQYDKTGSLRESMMYAYVKTYDGVPPGPKE